MKWLFLVSVLPLAGCCSSPLPVISCNAWAPAHVSVDAETLQDAAQWGEQGWENVTVKQGGLDSYHVEAECPEAGLGPDHDSPIAHAIGKQERAA